MSIDAMKLALESIDWLVHHLTQHHGCLHMNPTASGIPAWLGKTEAVLRAAIEQAQPRQWQGLTDEEIERACVPLGAAMLSFTEVARAIEAKLKEKNT